MNRGRVFGLSVALALAGAIEAQEPARSKGWVVIPVSEYATLHARAFPAAGEQPASPVAATLTRVDYDLRVTGELAVGRATLTLDALEDSWTAAPIPASLRIREASLNGKPATLVPAPDGSGRLLVILSKRGRATLSLDVALPVTLSSGDEVLSIPASASGVTRASVVLARQDVQIDVHGGVVTETSNSPTESRWVVYARGDETLNFTWRRKVEDHRVGLPLRMRGSLVQMAGLGEDSTSIYAEANVEVTQGECRQLKIQAPEKITVNQVQGTTVADWEVKGGELVVTFLQPVEDKTSFVISGEAQLPHDGSIDVPLLRLLEVERDTGGVAVDVLGAGEIKGTKPQGLEPAQAAELGQTVASRQSASLVAFRIRPAPGSAIRSLTVEVARYAQQAVLTANVEEARYHVLMSVEGKTLVLARYAVRNNQRNFVRLGLPAGAALWNASLAGRTVVPGQASDGALLFPLAKARSGEEAFAIEVLYLAHGNAWTEKGEARLALPSLDLPVSRTGLVLYHPPNYRVTARAGAFRLETYQRPSTAVLSGSGPVRAAEEVNIMPRAVARAVPPALASAPAQAATQSLVDKYNASYAVRTSAVMAAGNVTFPVVGPALYFVSELTAENQAPALDLSYEREKRGGRR